MGQHAAVVRQRQVSMQCSNTVDRDRSLGSCILVVKNRESAWINSKTCLHVALKMKGR
jgi:hypothetical protein